MKTRREILKTGIEVVGGLLVGSVLTSCASDLNNQNAGTPWRCEKCGKLLRSHEDMSDRRCPRCYSKRLVRITEDELADYLSQ